MKKFMITLICIGLFAITCTKNDGIDPIYSRGNIGVESMLLVDPPPAPTGLTSDKTHLSGCTSVIISSVAFSRNGATCPPTFIGEKGILLSTSSGILLYPPPPGNPTSLIYCSQNFDCGIGAFSITLSNLSPNVLYYARTYAWQVAYGGTPKTVGYGETESFYVNKPYIMTRSAFDISGTTATSGIYFDDQGCSLPTAVGICWSTSSNPTISNSHSTQTPAAGDDWEMLTYMTGLAQSTTYYVRSYATNSQGTFYGDQRTFTTITCPTFGQTGGFITVSPTSISAGVATNINATVNNYQSGTTITRAAAYKYHITGTITTSNWNGTNPCWSGLNLALTPSGYVGSYFTQQMTITKAGCPSDVKTAKIFVNN